MFAKGGTHLKAELVAAGKPIPDFDTAIAATALAKTRVVVSANRHIAEIPGVDAENWASG